MLNFYETGKPANDPYHTDTATQELMAQLIDQIISEIKS
jgi:hypothetical protein